MTDERWRECKHHHDGCACREHAWEERVAGLETEIARLKGETYCAYCGKRFLLDAPDATEHIGQHIAECPKHPMRIVEAERDAARAEVERIKGDRVGWAARSKEQFDRIGVALERVREHPESGEPARDDATEVEALVENVIHLEIESGHWIVRSMDLEREVERLKAANAKWENELLKELFVWADNWLSDEAKDQGARAVLQRVRAALAGTTDEHRPEGSTP